MKPASERIFFREFTTDDASLIYHLNSDPEVTKYVHEAPTTDLNIALSVITNRIIPQYREYGYGRWAAVLKDTNTFIGWCGLKFITEDNETDLGYRFFQKHWGKGYATESAKAILDYGTNILKLKNIMAKAAKENVASINVLKKLGMIYLKDDLCAHDPAEVYIFSDEL